MWRVQTFFVMQRPSHNLAVAGKRGALGLSAQRGEGTSIVMLFMFDFQVIALHVFPSASCKDFTFQIGGQVS